MVSTLVWREQRTKSLPGQSTPGHNSPSPDQNTWAWYRLCWKHRHCCHIQAFECPSVLQGGFLSWRGIVRGKLCPGFSLVVSQYNGWAEWLRVTGVRAPCRKWLWNRCREGGGVSAGAACSRDRYDKLCLQQQRVNINTGATSSIFSATAGSAAAEARAPVTVTAVAATSDMM